jgi:uncharacterized glyoxalase superfamily protein PhnB
MNDTAPVGLWPTLSVRDADAMIAWLEAVGFVAIAVHRDEQDPARVVHGEMRWPGGGGIMFGSHREGSDVTTRPGGAAAYLVTDDPDAAFAAAVAAGGTVRRAMVDQDYGGRGGSVADPEGNVWSFGDYRPA